MKISIYRDILVTRILCAAERFLIPLDDPASEHAASHAARVALELDGHLPFAFGQITGNGVCYVHELARLW
jgi:hypothetical protein